MLDNQDTELKAEKTVSHHVIGTCVSQMNFDVGDKMQNNLA